MNIRNFVSGSSVVLAGWLGATFLNEVPSQRYPKLDKDSSTSARPADSDAQMVSAVEENDVLRVSASR
ncbi:MAG: hypothetical protein WEB60_06825 [Terrimicrobiaceae bacterium]